MEKSKLGNFFCWNGMMNVCNSAYFVSTFTYDKHMVSLITNHNVSILLATISSFSTEPQHSSKTVILHKHTLH